MKGQSTYSFASSLSKFSKVRICTRVACNVRLAASCACYSGLRRVCRIDESTWDRRCDAPCCDADAQVAAGTVDGHDCADLGGCAGRLREAQKMMLDHRNYRTFRRQSPVDAGGIRRASSHRRRSRSAHHVRCTPRNPALASTCDECAACEALWPNFRWLSPRTARNQLFTFASTHSITRSLSRFPVNSLSSRIPVGLVTLTSVRCSPMKSRPTKYKPS